LNIILKKKIFVREEILKKSGKSFKKFKEVDKILKKVTNFVQVL
jgi:hypothetical protein